MNGGGRGVRDGKKGSGSGGGFHHQSDAARAQLRSVLPPPSPAAAAAASAGVLHRRTGRAIAYRSTDGRTSRTFAMQSRVEAIIISDAR